MAKIDAHLGGRNGETAKRALALVLIAEALKSGAFDYITKPIDFETLRVTMERALVHTRLQQENEDLRRELARFQVPEIIGVSPGMRQLLEMVALFAPSDATILITGESGTGKGLGKGDPCKQPEAR